MEDSYKICCVCAKRKHLVVTEESWIVTISEVTTPGLYTCLEEFLPRNRTNVSESVPDVNVMKSRKVKLKPPVREKSSVESSGTIMRNATKVGARKIVDGLLEIPRMWAHRAVDSGVDILFDAAQEHCTIM